MATPIVVISFGEDKFRLAGLKASEMMRVKSWTGYKSRNEWFGAIAEEDVEALIAALLIVKKRKGESVRWDDGDFDYDELDGKFFDEHDQEVEPAFVKNEDDSLKRDSAGRPVPLTDEKGEQVWNVLTTGEPVPFEPTA